MIEIEDYLILNAETAQMISTLSDENRLRQRTFPVISRFALAASVCALKT